MRACQNIGMDYKELLIINSNEMPDGKHQHLESIRRQKIMQIYRLVKDIGAGRGGFVIRKQNRVM